MEDEPITGANLLAAFRSAIAVQFRLHSQLLSPPGSEFWMLGANRMLKLYPFCSLQGEKFSPKRAAEESGILLEDASEVGELGVRWRYRGLPQP